MSERTSTEPDARAQTPRSLNSWWAKTSVEESPLAALQVEFLHVLLRLWCPFATALPLARAKRHDASHQFGGRLHEHVEEHGANGWRDRIHVARHVACHSLEPQVV